MTSVNPPRRATTRRQIGYRGGGGGLPGSGKGDGNRLPERMNGHYGTLLKPDVAFHHKPRP